MCIVSMVVDQYQKQWPQPFQDWTKPQVTDFSEILKRLGKLDEQLGAKDCIDAKKDELIKKLEERIKELETETITLNDAIKYEIKMHLEKLYIAINSLQDGNFKRISIPNHVTINLIKEVLNESP